MRFNTFRDLGIIVMAGAVTAAVIDELRPSRPAFTPEPQGPAEPKLSLAAGLDGRYGRLYSIVSHPYSGEPTSSYVRPAGRDEWRASIIAADLSDSPVFGVQSRRDLAGGDCSARIILPEQQAWADALQRRSFETTTDTAYYQVLAGPEQDPEPELIAYDTPLTEDTNAIRAAAAAVTEPR